MPFPASFYLYSSVLQTINFKQLFNKISNLGPLESGATTLPTATTTADCHNNCRLPQQLPNWDKLLLTFSKSETTQMKAIFFIFSVAVERWCRLRGNLLFYFKSRDHWSEPAGVIVIEGCEVKPDVNPLESTFGILLIFGGGEMLKNIFF